MRGIARYQKNHVEVASPSQLLLMLLRKAVLKLDEAAEAHEAQDWSSWQSCLHRVRAIYSELAMGLDSEHPPDLCDNLRRLYLWCIRELNTAATTKDIDKIPGVRRVTETLLEAWVDSLGEDQG